MGFIKFGYLSMWQLFQASIYSLKSSFSLFCPKRIIVSIVCMKKVCIMIVVKRFFVGLLTRIQESDDKGVCTRALWCLSKQNLDGVIVNTKVRIIIFSVSHVCSLTPSLLDLFMAACKESTV